MVCTNPLLEQYRAYLDNPLSARKRIDFVDCSISTSRSGMDELTLNASDTEELAVDKTVKDKVGRKD